MKRLGIILCEVFEEEMLELLKKNNFDSIIVVDSESSKYFKKKLEEKIPAEKRKIARKLCSPRF
ncbi:MAG: hypothetical protein GYA51_10605 [Candidatus Methanofastidiosa archaeon]|jgi:hypothetical protein|nr:hypothetical protein [Candidatus Methanofastidiosa archaeon]